MVKTGEVTPLYYTDLVSPDGEIIVSPDVPELLPFTHYYRQVFGKMPSGIKYDALKAANMSSTNMTRLIMLPPNSPAEAITTLRQAIVSLSKDSDFNAEAMKVMRFQPASKSASRASGCFRKYPKRRLRS
jgi:hypothetical protein